ncbi:acetylornithine deacetylase [Aliisedimentitalea scapharcae]|uniref:Acetylornithine deacetylase n=1 Tax=Aliisedimentitalea scapharcae TaxID=1524259 RepID=A0ABZ2XTF0_9RHOB
MTHTLTGPSPDLLEETIEILRNLVGFDSISGRSTHPILGYVRDYLAAHGVETTLSYDDTGERANLFATIGPQIDGGVVLNGHTDVVPVDGQVWATDPFVLTRMGNQLFGRGSVDMKGFLACVLASVPVFQAAELKHPIHIAFSYDEEIGGLGMPVLLDAMAGETYRPEVVIVGEPTNMTIVTGHKGGYEMRTEVIGHAVHSCDPTKGANAINAATKLIAKIEEMGTNRAAHPIANSAFDPAYPTFNIGTIEGGAARNATAGWCNFKWEYRPMPGEDGAAVITEVAEFAETEILPALRAIAPDTDIRIITETAVPPLDDRNAAKAAEFVSALTGINDTRVVSFGTDAGYFSDAAYSTVVFGPGDINRAHKPDEFITVEELTEGLDFLKRLSDRLSQ